MTFIPTILPKDINAVIDIPDDFIGDMLEWIKDSVITDVGDHYELSPALHGNVNPKHSDPNVIAISHEFLANLLIKKYPLELMMYYQQNEHKSINVGLLHVLVRLLHRDSLFMSARNKELLPTSEPLEDMIEFDEAATIPITMYQDQASYTTTMDIITKLANQLQK